MKITLNTITNLLQQLQVIFKTKQVYLAGGALAPHPTHDYDIVIINDWFHKEIYDEVTIMCQVGIISEVEIYKAYGLGEEEDNKFHTKAVCNMNGVKVDLLFADSTDFPTIEDVMLEFPLSIQMQALDSKGNIIRGKNFSLNPIKIYRTGCVKSCIEKYKTYYPNTEFI